MFFTRDGILLPVIKGEVVWGLDRQPASQVLYPVVSFRGKLSTVKLNLGRTPFVYKESKINQDLDNPCINICLDKTLLKRVTFGDSKSKKTPMLDMLYKYLTQSQDRKLYPLIKDFFDRMTVIGGSSVTSQHKKFSTSHSVSNLHHHSNQSGLGLNNAFGYKNSLTNLLAGGAPPILSHTVLSLANNQHSQSPIAQFQN